MKTTRSKFGSDSIVLWLARATSLASLGVLAMFVFGGREASRFNDASELLGFLFFPVGVAAGMLLAWKWPLVGAATALVSLFGFYVWHAFRSGSLPSGPWFLIFSLPAGLFLVAAILDRSKPQQTNDPGPPV